MVQAELQSQGYNVALAPNSPSDPGAIVLNSSPGPDQPATAGQTITLTTADTNGKGGFIGGAG